MKRITYIFLMLAGMLVGCRPNADIEFPNTPAGNVEALWSIIDTKYCFTEEKGLDWAGVKAPYMERAAQLDAKDYEGLFDLCAEMLDTLRDGHVNLYSAFDVSVCRSWYDTFPANFSSSLQARYLQGYRIAGSIYYTTIADGKIGYMYYSSFSNGISGSHLNYIFRSFQDCRGLIVDVRNNGGGNLETAYFLASAFFSESRTVGYWQHKTGKGHHDFSELAAIEIDKDNSKNKWLRPVVVLSNRRCYSATNTFISAMRYADNAHIVGGITGGGGGMPLSYELPNGWMVRFSSVKMYDRDTVSIEDGVQPDIEVRQHSTDRDDLIEEAIKVIKNEYD